MATATKTQHTLEIQRGKTPNLIRALSNALLFAGKDFTLPFLAAVRFEFDGQDLTLAATDRYRLSVEKVEYRNLAPADEPYEPAPAFSFSLPTPAVKAVVQQLKASQFDLITVTYDEDAHTMRVGTHSGTAEHQTPDGNFPNYRSVIPDLNNRVEVDQIGFNAKGLADLAKVQTARGKVSTIRVGLYGEKKPTRIDFLEGPTVLLMPTNLSSTDANNSTAGWGAL